MSKQTKYFAPLLIGLLFLVFLFSSYAIYKNETELIKEKINYKLSNNTVNLKEYFLTAESLLYSMKYTIEDKFALGDYCVHPSFKAKKYDENKNLFKVFNMIGLTAIDLSSITGIGNPKDFSQEKINKINSALYLKPIFNSAMEIIPDLKWVYYISSDNFIYISPDHIYKSTEGFKNQYKFSFWMESIPENNPDQSLVITSLYEDAIGKGLMTTISLPINHCFNFEGLVAIDIGLNTLNTLIPKLDTIGNTHLINEKDQFLASKEEFKINEKIDLKDLNFLKKEIVKNQLFLIHTYTNLDLNKKAFYNASGKILIMFLFLLSLYLTIYLKNLLEKVQYYANTDPLTNLLNRRSMQKAIDKLMDISKRYNQDLSFLLIDIDFFKKINDTYGHQIGDKVLVELSRMLKNNTRNCDIVARFGGEEFLITLVNTDIEEAFLLAERIRDATQKIKIDNLEINFTISIGCTKLQKNDNFYSLLRRVDNLLYQAKNRGRNRTQRN